MLVVLVMMMIIMIVEIIVVVVSEYIYFHSYLKYFLKNECSCDRSEQYCYNSYAI